MALLLCGTCVIFAIVAFALFGNRIVAWMWGRVVIFKTQFTRQDELLFKGLLGRELPLDAHVDWAMYFHTFRGETETAFRIQLPMEEAATLRKTVEPLGVMVENFNAQDLTPDLDRSGINPKFDAAFLLQDQKVDWIVFGKAVDNRIPVYFEIHGWPERDIHAIDSVFIPPK
jgi:hypothetical protein